MMRFILLILRIAVVALLLLPVVKPTISEQHDPTAIRHVNLVTNKSYSGAQRQAAIEHLKKAFGPDTQVALQNQSGSGLHPLQVYDAVGESIRNMRDFVVLDLDSRLWGEVGNKFEEKLLQTDAAKTNRLYVLNNSTAENEEGPSEFLLVSDLYVPKVSFLGEETIAVVEIAGKLPPSSEESAEILVRSNSELITTVRTKVVAPASGIIQTVVNIPVSFLKAQAQTLNVTLRSTRTMESYANASTTVFVAHNKTTVLHVAVGPDWSLRSMRQKLKFWPNLDLLSYYILRERWDDNSVPQSQLSLIEFPSDKLFGEQLPNFHGIVAQNFYFDHYLAQRDALNLVDYVKKGGRMFIQAGPLSFLSRDPAIQVLFPCSNQPEIVSDTQPVRWRSARESVIQMPQELTEFLPSIQSSTHFRNCDPKESAHVLAELQSGEPILFAQNLGKGLVITSLAADWHTQSIAMLNTAGSQSASAASLGANLQATASEKLMNWIVEFLQRRQDSGLRAPDLAGPRLAKNDTFLLTRSRGAFRQDAEIIVSGADGATVRARPVRLPFLDKEGLALEEPIASILSKGTVGGFHQIGLVVASSEQSPVEESQLVRSSLWPVALEPTEKMPPNPKFLSGVPATTSRAEFQSSRPNEQARSLEDKPIIEVYPWLLALALGLLCIDTLISVMMGGKPMQRRQ
jgi:hypothetical protein